MEISDLTSNAAALSFFKRAAKETMKLCAASAEDFANHIETEGLTFDAATALRILADMFREEAA